MKTFVLRNVDHANELIRFLKEHAGPAASDGRPLAVSVAEHKAQRSGEQNRLFHALLNQIAEQATVDGRQYSAEVWKEQIRRRFIGLEEIDLPDGTRTERGISTKSLNVGEFSNLIEIVRAWAQTDLNIEV
jgi:predicted RNA-binding protein YlxR (DUF448 family)